MSVSQLQGAVSLRQRLVLLLIPSLIAVLLLTATWSYKSAMDAANHAYDRSLTTAIKGIADHIHATGGRVIVDIPYSAMEFSDQEVQERIYYAILAADGGTLTGDEGLHSPLKEAAPKREPAVTDTRFRQHPVRMAILAKRLYDPELTSGDTITILFAETTEARNRLAFQLFLDSLRWQLLLVASGLILIMIVLSKSFRPLLALRESIRQRSAEDLTPVPVAGVPTEVLPLIEAINHHIARLAALLQARRRFLADAAHQIRTPLAVLGTQAEYGGRQEDPEEMRRTFGSMLNSIRGTRHMANQMLSLARAEQVNGLIRERSRVDLAELALEVAGDFAVLAVNKSIDLAYDGPRSGAFVEGNGTMLREMISNVLDNALRYTPKGGHVILSLTPEPDQAILSVSDNGPGIPQAEVERVFQRFYRILGTGDVEGSGLGLCIVREIVNAHGGSIHLAPGIEDRGVSVHITLPCAPTHSSLKAD